MGRIKSLQEIVFNLFVMKVRLHFYTFMLKYKCIQNFEFKDNDFEWDVL